MKLLSKVDIHKKVKKENDDLLEQGVHLRKSLREKISALNNAKSDYSEDKVKKLEEYDKFCKEIIVRKSKLLKELSDIEKEIENRKDIYYGLIEKMDALEEKEYQIKEREDRLSLRESFVASLEERQKQLIK